jgi:hypothetical protein
MTATLDRNRRDYCILLDGIETEVCTRQFPAWLKRFRYRIPFFGIQGFFADLVFFFIRFGASFPLNKGHDTATEQIVLAAASDLGLLQTVSGTPFLRSIFPALQAKKLLSYGEAWRLVKRLIDDEAAILLETPEDVVIGTVPVILGRLATHYSLAAITKTTTVLNINAVQIIQTADGRVYCFMTDFFNLDRTLQAVINYHTYYIASPYTTDMRGI